MSASGAFVPVVAAFHVKLIGLRILRALLGDLLFFRAAQFRAQFVRDIARDLLLQGDDVGGFALVLLAPDFGVVLHAGEVGADLDACPRAARLVPVSRASTVKSLPILLNVNIFAFVAEDGVAGFHFQLRHVGEAGDQGFGEAVAQEIGVGIAARVGEWESPQWIRFAMCLPCPANTKSRPPPVRSTRRPLPRPSIYGLKAIGRCRRWQRRELHDSRPDRCKGLRRRGRRRPLRSPRGGCDSR